MPAISKFCIIEANDIGHTNQWQFTVIVHMNNIHEKLKQLFLRCK